MLIVSSLYAASVCSKCCADMISLSIIFCGFKTESLTTADCALEQRDEMRLVADRMWVFTEVRRILERRDYSDCGRG